jgi:hypothetical protein
VYELEKKKDARTRLRAGAVLGSDSMPTTGNTEKLSISEFLESDPGLSLKLAKGYHENAKRTGFHVGMSQDEIKAYIDSVSSENCSWDAYFLCLHSYCSLLTPP